MFSGFLFNLSFWYSICISRDRMILIKCTWLDIDRNEIRVVHSTLHIYSTCDQLPLTMDLILIQGLYVYALIFGKFYWTCYGRNASLIFVLCHFCLPPAYLNRFLCRTQSVCVYVFVCNLMQIYFIDCINCLFNKMTIHHQKMLEENLKLWK